MGIAYFNAPARAPIAARALLLLTLSLGGCATSTAGSSLMDARAEAPPQRKSSGYLPVEDLPLSRELMKTDEQTKLKKELTAARDRQAAAAKAEGGAPQAVRPSSQAVRP
ncbi:hypothetical protein [Bradyrhizobium sp. Tv2a-2]|uniref:hypothetical protein n=1 Tax=Bradyrhizobium sp. Tv2a-2 TaxID=113395 RepID=UPI000410EC90|nr:hypothetical protein [Bradyrhizobium sp. Tv2a-2]